MQQLQVIFFERNREISLLERYQKVNRIINASKRNIAGNANSNLDPETPLFNKISINKEQSSSDIKNIEKHTNEKDNYEDELEQIPKKFQFQQKERLRIQRQNWILKIIKSAKNVNQANLQQIYQIALDMMKYYDPLFSNGFNGLGDKDSTTEGIINLFINFYTRYRESELATIKKIIRPNNKFIVFDLIKQLVETHRQYFKVKLLQSFKQIPKNQVEKMKCPLPQSQSESQENQKIIVNQSAQKKDQVSPINKLNVNLWPQLQSFLDQYHLNVINNLGTPAFLKESVNQLYNELFNLNQNRGVQYSINQYFEQCWDFAHRSQNLKFKNHKNKGYNYDLSKLYTQEEINGINKKLETKIQHNQLAINKFENRIYQNSAKLKKLEPSQDLQQFFKFLIENQQNSKRLNENRLKTGKSPLSNPILEQHQINKYIPIVVKRYLGEYYRLELYIIHNEELIPISQFESKYGTSIKSYLKTYRINMKNVSNDNNKPNKIAQIQRPFKKHKFFSLNRSKVKQLLSDEVLSRLFTDSKKKQSIFPLLRSNQLKQEELLEIPNKKNSRSLNQIRNRTISQQKLVPLFKNQILSHRIEAEQPNFEFYEYKTKKLLQSQSKLEEGMKKSQMAVESQISELCAFKMGYTRKTNQSMEITEDKKKKKIDSIIDSIIKQRNLKLS